MSTTFEPLSAILVRDYKVEPERLTLDASLEGLGIDSLGAVELLWTMEDTFNIKLPASHVELATLGDVVRYLDELVARQSAGRMTATPMAPVLRMT